jgi:tetraprenyl-beta-curcumene synthase
MGGMQTSRTAGAREILALVLTGIEYWLTIYPRARREIHHWKRRARRIPDPALRAAAQATLNSEHLNPEAAAFFAVLASRRCRAALIRVIVDFQIAYDYLDSINEDDVSAPLRNGLQLHRALIDAVSPDASCADYYEHHPQSDDGEYLAELVRACQGAIRELPSAGAIEPVLVSAAERCGQGQSRNHAMLVEGQTQLVEWTSTQAGRGGYLWWELAAAGISCLSVHALFAAAACETTRAEAERVDEAYFRPICAISALLDSLVDAPRDVGTTNHNFFAHYDTCTQAAERFAAITAEARALLGALRNRCRHMVILAGIASFYLSAPEASTDFARPVALRTIDCLGPTSAPILAVMRLRRRSADWWSLHNAAARRRRAGSARVRSSREPVLPCGGVLHEQPECHERRYVAVRGAGAQAELSCDFDDAAALFAGDEQREYQQAAEQRVREPPALELHPVALFQGALRDRLLGDQPGEQQVEAWSPRVDRRADDAFDLRRGQLERDLPIARTAPPG